jgi:hypothetical protein
MQHQHHGAGAGAMAGGEGSSGGEGGLAPLPLGIIDLSRTFSVMGYCLLPIVILSAVAVFLNLQGGVGTILGVGAVIWCTLSAARMFEAALALKDQRWLIA